MKYLFLVLIILSGCARVRVECPPTQVKVIEDAGLASERVVCYTPGVSYTDYRPLSQKVVK